MNLDQARTLIWNGEPMMLRDYLRGHGVPDAFGGRLTLVLPGMDSQ